LKVTRTELDGVLLVETRVFGDNRGYFFESYNASRYQSAGIDCDFIQDNISFSNAGVIRGLHCQYPTMQAKLIQVLDGAVLDVAVDIRRGSPTFGNWTGEILSSENRRQLFIPAGFAHGFAVIGERALVSYKCSARYDPSSEVTIRWDDPEIGVDWAVINPTVSEKDQAGLLLSDLPSNRLPVYEL